MKIYTRTGDRGTTSLFSGGRVGKDDARVEAYGSVDELTSVIGLLRSEELPVAADIRLRSAQDALLCIGATLADPERRGRHDPGEWNPQPLEAWIDEMEEELDPLTTFILPGGSRAAALAHVARTVCRRAERRVLSLAGAGEVLPPHLVAYLNRLSDALFVVARWFNLRAGVDESPWPTAGAD